MSTAVLESPLPRPDAERRPSLARLTAVELRKTVDTRAGFWLLVGIVCLTIAALIAVIFAGEVGDHTLKNMVILAAVPSAWFLPLAGILLVSSEWSQRTTLITFALVPRRARVLLAKLFAGVVLAGAALVVAFAFGALGTAVARPGLDDTWSLHPTLLGQVALYVLASMLMGVGFGALLLSSPPAIVLYLVTPIGFSAIGAIPWFTGVAPWLDWWSSVSILADKPLDASEWARAGTTLAVWMVLPLLVGLWRVTRSEVA
jgi:ABC-2 type transport system permease protein